MKASLKGCSILHPFFMFTGSQHPSLQLVSQFSSTDLPPHHQFHSESSKICSQTKKKKCTCKCLSSFPLQPCLQVSICPSQVSHQVIATILLPGLTMKPGNTFSQSSESVSHYDWHTNSQLEHITPTGIPLVSRLHSDSFWPSILKQVWTKGLRQKKTTDVPPPGWHSPIPYVHLTAPEQQQEWDLDHKIAEAEAVYFIMGKFNTLYDTTLSLCLN